MSKAKAKEEAAVEKAKPEAPVQVTVAVTTAPAKRVSFEQWASRRGIKDSHKRGMRAFAKNPDKVRTMDEWDAVFKAY